MLRIILRGTQLGTVLILLGLGSCTLHSGLKPRSYSSGEESFFVGFGVAVLAAALILFRKWFFGSSELEKSTSPPTQKTTSDKQTGDDSFPNTEPEMLANFPVYLWAEQQEPFKTWHGPNTQVPVEMIELFRLAAHAYLFFLWHLWIVKEFGSTVATRVRAEQIKRVDRLGEALGAQLFGFVDEIERVVAVATEAQFTIPGRPEIMMPPIYGVALSVLTTWRGSPYFVDATAYDLRLPDMHDNDFLLTECLAHCGDAAGPLFANLVNTFSIDARALAQWVSATKH